jgi:cell division septation protein DedD
MTKLEMVASPEIKFSIKPNIDGDVIDTFEFIVKKIKEEVEIEENEPVKESAVETISIKKSADTTSGNKRIQGPDKSIVYSVQLAALRQKADINSVFSALLKAMPQLKIQESLEKDGLYRYRTGKFSTPREARELAKKIVISGWKDYYIVNVKNTTE